MVISMLNSVSGLVQLTCALMVNGTSLVLEIVMVVKGLYKSKFFDIYALCSESMVVVHFFVLMVTFGEPAEMRQYGESIIVVSNTYYNYLMVAIYAFSIVLSVGTFIRFVYKKIKKKCGKEEIQPEDQENGEKGEKGEKEDEKPKEDTVEELNKEKFNEKSVSKELQADVQSFTIRPMTQIFNNEPCIDFDDCVIEPI